MIWMRPLCDSHGHLKMVVPGRERERERTRQRKRRRRRRPHQWSYGQWPAVVPPNGCSAGHRRNGEHGTMATEQSGKCPPAWIQKCLQGGETIVVLTAHRHTALHFLCLLNFTPSAVFLTFSLFFLFQEVLLCFLPTKRTRFLLFIFSFTFSSIAQLSSFLFVQLSSLYSDILQLFQFFSSFQIHFASLSLSICFSLFSSLFLSFFPFFCFTFFFFLHHLTVTNR